METSGIGLLHRDGDRESIAPPRPLSGNPFVLIDDARPGGRARLFARPDATIAATRPAELPAVLARLEQALNDGRIAAGYLAYEAGGAFEPRWPGAAPAGAPAGDGWPLLWFGLFAPEDVFAGAIEGALPDAAAARVGAVRPLVDRAWHAAAMARILALIAAGDIYQANLTFPCEVDWSGDPLALYARIRAASRAGHGGIVDLGDRALLSASPELFFALEDGRVTARPMKGTAPRSGDAGTDRLRAAALRASPKERAENLMITDLLRNDLSRIAVPGSVEAGALFTVETYPTVLQMTSTIEARLAPGLGPIDILRAAFPCGSVTGAPKLRAAEVIDAIEIGPRGPYTGAIGWMRKDAAHFNVAIRTLQIEAGGPARLGLGSGIVADSEPAREWDECLAKAAFLA